MTYMGRPAAASVAKEEDGLQPPAALGTARTVLTHGFPAAGGMSAGHHQRALNANVALFPCMPHRRRLYRPQL